MFSADLSWADATTEKVGERRERKARERSTRAGSIDTSTSSRSSVSADRELWWTSGLKKAKSVRPSILRPTTSRSTSSQKAVPFKPRQPDNARAFQLKDPTLQPGWTYSTTLSPSLPSGTPLDLPVSEVPELEGDSSSRYTDSTELRISSEINASRNDAQDSDVAEGDRRWNVITPNDYDSNDNVQPPQRTSPGSFVTSRTRRSSAATERDEVLVTPSLNTQKEWKMRSQTTDFGGTLSLEPLKLYNSVQDTRTSAEARHGSIGSGSRGLDRPLSQWDCLTPRKVPEEMRLPPKRVANKAAIAHSSTNDLTRFQRFIRRMEGAGPKIVLDRLKEDWQESLGDELDDEVAFEKQLWLLTGFQLQNSGKGRMAPVPGCDTGRILELYGNLSEVYQMSAMHPAQTVHFLTTKPQRSIPLPGNVSYLTVRDCGTVPLPYPENYFSHIRASTLPSLVPSAKLPEVFIECYKLLAPGGLLEIRIMDAAPVRRTAGPLMRMWIEDRLSINLERLFRCSKPCSLVPGWLEEAGFELTWPEGSQNVILPCAFDTPSTGVEKELATTIGRALWKDIWGPFVDDIPGESRWWWEDDEIVQECLKRQTALECKAIFAYKR